MFTKFKQSSLVCFILFVVIASYVTNSRNFVNNQLFKNRMLFSFTRSKISIQKFYNCDLLIYFLPSQLAINIFKSKICFVISFFFCGILIGDSYTLFVGQPFEFIIYLYSITCYLLALLNCLRAQLRILFRMEPGSISLQKSA